jgi:hypothetical protein
VGGVVRAVAPPAPLAASPPKPPSPEFCFRDTCIRHISARFLLRAETGTPRFRPDVSARPLRAGIAQSSGRRRAITVGEDPRRRTTSGGSREHGGPGADSLRKRVRPRERRGVDTEQPHRGSWAGATDPGVDTPCTRRSEHSTAQRPHPRLARDEVADDE